MTYIPKELITVARQLSGESDKVVLYSHDMAYIVNGHKVLGSVYKDGTEFVYYSGDDTGNDDYDEIMEMAG